MVFQRKIIYLTLYHHLPENILFTKKKKTTTLELTWHIWYVWKPFKLYFHFKLNIVDVNKSGYGNCAIMTSSYHHSFVFSNHGLQNIMKSCFGRLFWSTVNLSKDVPVCSAKACVCVCVPGDLGASPHPCPVLCVLWPPGGSILPSEPAEQRPLRPHVSVQ